MVFVFPPLVLTLGGLLLVGRGLYTGVTERAGLLALSVWMLWTAAAHMRPAPVSPAAPATSARSGRGSP